MKKGKLLKRSLACILSLMMIIASMPVAAVSVSASTSGTINHSYDDVISHTATSNKRYKTAAGFMNIANDGQATNFSFAVWQYPVSDLLSNVKDGHLIENATVSFTKDNALDASGLTFYYATKNFTTGSTTYPFTSGLLSTVLSDKATGIKALFNNEDSLVESSGGTVRSGYLISNLGLETIQAFTASETKNNTEFSLDISNELQDALYSGYSYFTIIAMSPVSGKNGATLSDGSESWNDVNIKIGTNPISYSYSDTTDNNVKQNYEVNAKAAALESTVANASKRTYTSTASIDTTASSAGYMKGFYKQGSWTSKTYTKVVASNDSNKYNTFGVTGITGAVAIYNSENTDIRFPVIAHNDEGGASGKHGITINYNALPTNLSTLWELGENKWLRCSGVTNLARADDDNHNFFTTTSASKTDSQFYANETKQWRNYVHYTGSGNTSQYYDSIISFNWKYGCRYVNKTSVITQADIPVTYGVYVLNAKPIDDIIDEAKDDVSTYTAEPWKYDSTKLERYRKAIQAAVDFNAADDLGTVTLSNVQTAANKIAAIKKEYDEAKADLTVKSITVTFNKGYGQTETKTIKAGEAVGTIPSVTGVTKVSETQHATYSWPSSVQSTNIPHFDVTYTADQTLENHTVGTAATCQAQAVCSVCGSSYGDKLAHNYKYEQISNNAVNHTKTCLVGGEEVTEKHNYGEASTFSNGTCTDCKYVRFDASAYSVAMTNARAKINDASSYTPTSYQSYLYTVSTANTAYTNATTQEEVDAFTWDIICAEALLETKSKNITVELYDVNKSSSDPVTSTVVEGKYGETTEIKPEDDHNIVKWEVITNGSTQTIYGERSSLTYLVTSDATVKAYYDDTAKDESKTYTKVIFKGINGKVVDIKYVADGKTLKTSDVAKPSVALYTAGEWSVSSVTGSADTPTVIVTTSYTPDSSVNCGVHINGTTYTMPYNTRVNLTDAKYGLSADKKYALYAETDSGAKGNLLAYVDGTVFYVPSRKGVYVEEVDSVTNMTQAVGTFSTFTSKKGVEYKTVGFNCKFSLEDDCTPVEWGIMLVPVYNDGTVGTSIKMPVKALSAENEYTALVSVVATNTTYASIKAKSYLIYKDGSETKTIYGSEEVQSFQTRS